MLKGKKILIGVTGSIAAYKIPYLIRLLVKEGAEVQVILTENARDFITPLTISTLSKRPALTYPFNPDDGSWNNHVEMGGWADLMLVAPASASTLSKMVTGQADNLLLTTYLSAKCPVFFAPAMDIDMYKHVATQRNITQLVSYGHHLIEPQVGELASGLCGAGRMEEPENILKTITAFFLTGNQLKGKNVLVTAGPTYEPVDPVRFIGNHSSGAMGFALAEDAARRGADVTLITGPVSRSTYNQRIKRTDVTTAAQMYEAVTDAFSNAHIIIMSAAVADFTPLDPSPQKIKKDNQQKSILLKPTQDILAVLGEKKRAGQLLIGFALETNNELDNARKKLHTKNLDFIVLNSLKDKGAGFIHDTNKVTILTRSGDQHDYPLKSKTAVAADILDKAVEMLDKTEK
jgi:phosphopantothenoylcysteine decarboxylase / phosphopantothenate---cysteine ligase